MSLSKELPPIPSPVEKMYVVKRDGCREDVAFDKITERVRKLCYKLDLDYVDPPAVAKKVIEGLYTGVHTTELDYLAAETAASMTVKHPDYAVLAARIAVSNLHKETAQNFADVIDDLYNCYDPYVGFTTPMIDRKTYDIVQKNADELNAAIDYDRDYDYSYFGFKTLERSYLLRIDDRIVERPQHMLMRVAVGIHGYDIAAAIETYNLTSKGRFTHATPTLYNAGTITPQLSSCFLLAMREDSIEGIFDTLKQCALISKSAGGVGLHVHDIRSAGSAIRGTRGGGGGTSNGLVPMLRVFNHAARYADQGGNRRPGAFAVYLEPWHDDIYEFLDLRKNHGSEEMRARDLFYALWIPDLFMKRVESDGVWSLMCPRECPGLSEKWGAEFDDLYESYEHREKFIRRVRARDLWRAILQAQCETGMPYMLYKDACNSKSNQQNLGTIRCSNLCTEIIQFTSKDEIAVCNLASIAVNAFVRDDLTYDFEELKRVTKVVARNLDKIIDVNRYPVPEAEYSNKRHRPIGIGVQGLADAFHLMRYSFDCHEARRLNRDIFETIYFGALEASCELAKQRGTYETYDGSPVSRGILQFDAWGVKPTSGLWNWNGLREDISRYGIRNSLLTAPMPTASTAQILGNNESIEPYTSNIYGRRVLAGEFQVVNRHLLNDLICLKLWNEDVRNEIIANNGSIQNVRNIPADLKLLYRTVWEIPQKSLLDMAADRGPYIDQSQSLNVYVADPNHANLTSLHFYAWKLGLKTGMYYLRSRPAANAIQFTVDKGALSRAKDSNSEHCVACSS